jgi:hypothetical protein
MWRLWKREGLKVPKQTVKQLSAGSSENGVTRIRATRKNEVWCWDFVFDRTENRPSLKWFVVIDEFTRECVVLEVERKMSARDCIDQLSVAMRDPGDGDAQLAGGSEREGDVHRAGEPMGDWCGRELQRAAAGRAVERGAVPELGRNEAPYVRVEAGVQPGAAARALGYATLSELAADCDATKPMEKKQDKATQRVTVEGLPSGRHLADPAFSGGLVLSENEAEPMTRLS